MPNVRFIADPKLPRDWADKPYRKGYETAMSEDEADRWVRRGVAIIVTPAMAAAETRAANAAAAAAERPQSPEGGGDASAPIPDDWRDLHHMQRLSLARRLAPDTEIDTASEADEIIAAELERRAAVEHHQV